MDKSFSMHFNPISNAKTVNQYEEEIKVLQQENFKLKHENIELKKSQKSVADDTLCLLKDSEKSIKILQERLKKSQNEVNDISKSYKLKITSLEDENKRLLSCITNLNEEIKKLKNNSNKLEHSFIKEKNNKDDLIKELEAEKESLNRKIIEIEERFFLDKDELENNLHEKMKVLEKNIKEKETEVSNYKKYCSELREELERRENLITEKDEELSKVKEGYREESQLKDVYQNEIDYLKEKIENIERENRKLEERNDEVKDLLEESEHKLVGLRNRMKEKEEENSGIKKNFHFIKNQYHTNILRIMEELNNSNIKLELLANKCVKTSDIYTKKFKPYFRKIYNENKSLINEINLLKKEVGYLKEIQNLSPKNCDFLEVMGCKKEDSFDRIMDTFSKMYYEMVNKIKSMEREIGEITHFAENNKKLLHTRTLKLLDNFTK
ncbi:hypothetical protein H311_03653, partial [Anncaliia algerae PRA109]